MQKKKKKKKKKEEEEGSWGETAPAMQLSLRLRTAEDTNMGVTSFEVCLLIILSGLHTLGPEGLGGFAKARCAKATVVKAQKS